MSYAYANRRRSDSAAPQKESRPAQPSLEALRSGAAKPTQEQMGHRVDLPDAMRAKMEESFGADLSAVKLYESQTVADAGAEAVAQGANIAFAPGMLDFSSFGGQALLGHEISHVVSQARGEVTGGGFLNDHALEARADREGAMAAAGQQIAMPAAAMSSVSAAPAAGPMQAMKDKKKQAKATEISLGVNNGIYDRKAMRGQVKALSPIAKREIQSSGSKGLNDGNRYFYMRGGGARGDDRTLYLNSLKAAGNKVTAQTVGNMLTKQKSLPSLRGEGGIYNTYKQLLPKDGPISKDLEAYQQRAVLETQKMLENLEQNPDAMDALHKSQELYSSFGTFGEKNEDGSTNTAGMNGGKEEAAHRAINDLVLRSMGPQLVNTTQQMQQNGDLSEEEVRKAKDLSQAMTGMQARVMASVMNPDQKFELSDSEQAMKDLYHSFFERTGMITTQKSYGNFNLADVGNSSKEFRTYDHTVDNSKRDQPLNRNDKQDLFDRLNQKYTGNAYKKNSFGDISNGKDIKISGLNLKRMIGMMQKSQGDGYSEDEIEQLYDNLMAPHRSDLDPNDEEAMAAAQAQFDQGMHKLKDMHYNKLKRLESTYGTLGTQMHPADFVRLAGKDFNDHFHMGQDTEQLLTSAGKYFDFEHNEKDRELRDLHKYYAQLQERSHFYGAVELQDHQGHGMDQQFLQTGLNRVPITPEMIAKVHGPSMSPEQHEAYKADLKKRASKQGWAHRLFGEFA